MDRLLSGPAEETWERLSRDTEMEIKKTKHPVYGDCMVCAQGNEKEAQYFCVYSDRVLILSMSA